ncbi:13502_t:CDS:2, partial [Funneliformis mosseae]
VAEIVKVAVFIKVNLNESVIDLDGLLGWFIWVVEEYDTQKKVIDILEERNDLDFSQVQTCNTILHNSSKQTTYRFSHLIENMIIEAPIITQKCNVQFNLFTLDNLENCLFIAIISKGIHNHLPPPFVTTSSNILEQLNKIIEQENILYLTERTLLT